VTTKKNSQDLEKLAEAARVCACTNFRKASRAVTHLFDEALEPCGLRATQLVLLLEIVTGHQTTVPRLARRLVMDGSTVTRSLQPLMKRGLLTAKGSSGRRAQSLALTPKGQAILEEAVPLWESAQSRFIQSIGSKRWHRLTSDLAASTAAAF